MNFRNLTSTFLITLGITLLIQPLTSTKADDDNQITNNSNHIIQIEEDITKPKRLNINVANCLQQRLRSQFTRRYKS